MAASQQEQFRATIDGRPPAPSVANEADLRIEGSRSIAASGSFGACPGLPLVWCLSLAEGMLNRCGMILLYVINDVCRICGCAYPTASPRCVANVAAYVAAAAEVPRASLCGSAPDALLPPSGSPKKKAHERLDTHSTSGSLAARNAVWHVIWQ